MIKKLQKIKILKKIKNFSKKREKNKIYNKLKKNIII